MNGILSDLHCFTSPFLSYVTCKECILGIKAYPLVLDRELLVCKKSEKDDVLLRGRHRRCLNVTGIVKVGVILPGPQMMRILE
jgi:hypothetical protein